MSRAMLQAARAGRPTARAVLHRLGCSATIAIAVPAHSMPLGIILHAAPIMSHHSDEGSSCAEVYWEQRYDNWYKSLSPEQRGNEDRRIARIDDDERANLRKGDLEEAASERAQSRAAYTQAMLGFALATLLVLICFLPLYRPWQRQR